MFEAGKLKTDDGVTYVEFDVRIAVLKQLIADAELNDKSNLRFNVKIPKFPSENKVREYLLGHKYIEFEIPTDKLAEQLKPIYDVGESKMMFRIPIEGEEKDDNETIDYPQLRKSILDSLHQGPVPFQKCPKCDGQGTVSKPPYIAGDVYCWTATTSVFECDVCHGAKIIPMHVINKSE